MNLTKPEIKKQIARIYNELYGGWIRQLYNPTESDFKEATEHCFGLYKAVKREPNERWQYLRLIHLISKNHHNKNELDQLLYPESGTGEVTEATYKSAFINTIASEFLRLLREKLPAYDGFSHYHTIEEIKYITPDVFADSDFDEYTYEMWANGIADWTFLQAPNAEYGVARIAEYDFQPASGKQWVIHYATAAELRRIKDKQQELGEAYVTATLEAYKRKFLEGVERSQAKEQYYRQMLEQYERIVNDRDFVDTKLVYYYLTKGGRRWELLPRTTGQTKTVDFKNELAYLVNEYIVKGKDLYQHVTPKMLDTFNIDFPQGDAVAMYRFYRWLQDEYPREREGLPDIAPEDKSITFESLFATPEHRQAMLQALSQLEYIDTTGRWIVAKNRLGTLCDTLKSKGYLSDLALQLSDSRVIPIIAQHFRIKIVDRTTRDRPANNQEISRELKATLPTLP